MKKQKAFLWLTETLALTSGMRKLSVCECMLWPSPVQWKSQRHSGPRPLLHLPLTRMKAIASGWVITGPWVTSPRSQYKSSLQPPSLRERMYAVKAWQTCCGSGNARRCQVSAAVQVNAASLCDADEDAISLPLSLKTDCTLGDRAMLRQFRGIVFVERLDGRQMLVCANKVWPPATNFSSGRLFLKGQFVQKWKVSSFTQPYVVPNH